MRNDLFGTPNPNECMIINLDDNSGTGSHWVSLFIKDKVCYYFDSFGFPPPLEIVTYLKDFTNRYWSSFKIQDVSEIICGHYCIYVLLGLSNGTNFYTILDELHKYSLKNINNY